MIDEKEKRLFRAEKCNIDEFHTNKSPKISIGTKPLRSLQTDEEFEKLLYVKNWAVSQTTESKILILDSDKKNDERLDKFFNRSRRSFKKGEFISSKHAFIKVIDATHSEIKDFAVKFHITSGLEVYAENHWITFAGTYNSKKTEDLDSTETMPTSKWYYTDDQRAKAILEFTKSELDDVFGKLTSKTTTHNMSIQEIRNDDFVVNEGEDREKYLLKDLVSRIDKNKDIINDGTVLLAYAQSYNNKHCNPPLIVQRVLKIISQAQKYSSKHEETRGRKKKRLEKNTLNDKSKFCININHLLDEEGFFSYTEFADLMISKYHFKSLIDSKEILYYEDNGYKFNGEYIIRQICEYTLHEASTGMVLEIEEKIRRRTFVNRDDFDNFKDGFLNFINCRLNPETKQQKEYSHKDLVLTKLPVKYDKNAKCPKIMKFLKECLPNNKDRHSALEHLASCLLLELKLEKAIMYLGGGGNGKSTWFNVIDKFLGNQNISNLSIDEMIYDRFKVADLFGKLLNLYAEIGKKAIKELARFKLIISGDTITVEHKGGKPFKIKPRARHIFSLNKLPELDEETDAVFRRFDLIFWNQKFIDSKNRDSNDETTNNADLDLEYTLVTDLELSGLLNIILRVRRDLKNRKRFLYSKSIEEMRNLWKSESDSVTKFAENCLEISDGWIMLRSDLYRHYRTFCKEYLKEDFENEIDFMQKIQKSIYCKFQRYRIQPKNKTKFQCVLDIKFKSTMNVNIGYQKGVKAKTAQSNLSDIF